MITQLTALFIGVAVVKWFVHAYGLSFLTAQPKAVSLTILALMLVVTNTLKARRVRA
jgi:Flp pilus assembly protein TadB